MLKFTRKHKLILALGTTGLILLALSQNFNNHYIFPDSYKYIQMPNYYVALFSSNGKESLFDINFFTSLKPLTAILALIYKLGINIRIFNILLLLLSFWTIYISAKNKAIKSRYIIDISLLSLYVINGIVIYWISRYTTEFVSILFISLIIFLRDKKNNIWFTLVFILLTLIRPEFVFTYSLFNKRGTTSSQIFYYTVIITLWTIIALLTSSITLLLWYIICPLFIIHVFLRIHPNMKQLKRFVLNTSQILTLGIISTFFLVLLCLTVSNHITPSYISGAINTYILSVGITSLFIIKLLLFNTNKEDYPYLLTIIILSITYLWTAPDSFRYWLYMSPIMLYLLLKTDYKHNLRLVNLLSILLVCIQITVIKYSVPFEILEENYWDNRAQYLQNIIDPKSTVYSSTPIITRQYKLTSKDLCQTSYFDQGNIVLIDDYVIATCPHILETLNKHELTELPTYSTTKRVELNRYKSKRQTTYIYISK